MQSVVCPPVTILTVDRRTLLTRTYCISFLGCYWLNTIVNQPLLGCLEHSTKPCIFMRHFTWCINSTTQNHLWHLATHIFKKSHPVYAKMNVNALRQLRGGINLLEWFSSVCFLLANAKNQLVAYLFYYHGSGRCLFGGGCWQCEKQFGAVNKEFFDVKTDQQAVQF